MEPTRRRNKRHRVGEVRGTEEEYEVEPTRRRNKRHRVGEVRGTEEEYEVEQTRRRNKRHRVGEARSTEEEYEEVTEGDYEVGPLIPHPPKKPRLYAGIFSVIGLTFVILTVAALIATIIALRWDTWISGAGEENIGEYQILYVYLGVTGIIVCAMVSLVDVSRHWKDH